MNNAIATVPQNEMQLADTFHASGLFPDVRSAQQAYVKILAGKQYGLDPFTSMNGIYIIKGKTVMSAPLIAAQIKKSGKYNYKIKEHNEKICSIEFFEGGTSVGVSTFTIDMARKAGLSGTNWSSYPMNMLFARAISNGSRWYCPDIFGGAIYAEGEIDTQANQPQAKYELQDLQEAGQAELDRVITQDERKQLFGAASDCGVEKEKLRSWVLELTGAETTSNLTVAQMTELVTKCFQYKDTVEKGDKAIEDLQGPSVEDAQLVQETEAESSNVPVDLPSEEPIEVPKKTKSKFQEKAAAIEAQENAAAIEAQENA